MGAKSIDPLLDVHGEYPPDTMIINPYAFAGGAPQTASDDFNSYANGALLENQTNWASTSGSVKLYKPSSDAWYMGNLNGFNSVVRYTPGIWSANQYSEVTLTGTISSGNYIGTAVRADNSGNAYFFVVIAATLYLNVFNSGTAAGLTSVAVTTVTGDVWRLEVTGTGASTRLTVKQNGVARISSRDPGGTYINSGNPGVGTYNNGNTANFGGTYWYASDL